MSTRVALVIGQFEFVEHDVLLHPMGARVGRVRMQIYPTRWKQTQNVYG